MTLLSLCRIYIQKLGDKKTRLMETGETNLHGNYFQLVLDTKFLY